MTPKSPPHSIEAEQSVLGGLLLNNELWHELSPTLADSDFYRSDHQQLYRSIGAMVSAGKACDFVTLVEYLRNRGELENGTSSYVAQLAVDTYSISNVKAYGAIVRERSVQRRLIAVGTDIGDLGFEPAGRDPTELLEVAEQQVLAIRDMATAGTTPAQLRQASALLPAWMDQLEARRRAGRKFIGQATGFADLDYKLAGLQPGRLYVLAARPSVGKTALALNIAAYVAERARTLFFSAEMPNDELLDRAISSWSGVIGDRFRFPPELTDEDLSKISKATSHPALENLQLDDQSGMRPAAIRARARRAARKATVGLVVIDYLQLLYDDRTKPGETRHLEVSRIAAGFKQLAKELRAPVLLLSQLNRGAENRAEPRPRLADLRDSGGIEEHADCVLLLHRVRNDDGALDLRADLDIAKQRSGPTGRVYLQLEPELSRFVPAGPPMPEPVRQPPHRGMPD